MRPRHCGVVALALAAGAGAVLLAPSDGETQAAATANPLPLLGAADSEMTLMGSAPAGAPGEAWGYRRLPLTIGSVKASGRTVEFGAPPDPLRPDPQLAFLRHTAATGWQVYETPLDEAGQPYRGPVPNRLSARTTPGGGGVLVGRDTARPVDDQVVVLHRNPNGRFRALAAPPTSVLLSGESLAGERGSGEVAIAAVEEGTRTGLYMAPVGPAVEDAVLHFDGQVWTREPVEVPTGSEADFGIVAIGAESAGNAWALARTDPALGRGIVLFQRVSDSGGTRWVERSLGSSVFSDRDTPGQGLSEVGALGGPTQPITVTGDGVWVDGTVTSAGTARDFTLFYDRDALAVTGAWCDVGVCGSPLGVRLSRSSGYRSFAWAGSGFGTRVITNPLDSGGDERTNRGTYLRLSGGAFTRMPGGGGNFRSGGAFASATEGWLEGPVQITSAARPDRLRSWPVALRAPLTDVTPQPGSRPGSLGAQALAAGVDGAVARFAPGSGWKREFLLTSSGSVNRSALRGVAWPEAGRAHAVGDLGAMWQWNADSTLWEVDPGAPVGFEGNLLDVAFAPGDPDRGYAVGKGGILLSYGKSWEPEALPAGTGGRDLTQIAFAGGQAMVAAGADLLVNDGGGWRADPSVRTLLNRVRLGSPRLLSVAGLPDGGAVAAGRDFVLVRDRAGGAWRYSDQPLPGSTVIAAAAVRSGGAVRAVVSVIPQLSFPPADDIPEPDPNVPPPILPPFQLPGDGYVLRESATGWVDEQRTSFGGSGSDRPIKSDPILSFLLDPSGTGWAVGGWSGDADAAGRGSSARNAAGRSNRTRVRTAGIYRYGADATARPPAAGSSAIPLPAGPVRFAVGGHSQCEQPCADLAPQTLGPDRTLASALARARGIAGGRGVRAFLHTGGRGKSGLTGAEAARYAALLGSQPGLPVYPAVGPGDSAASLKGALSGFNAPLGGGAAPAGVSTAGIPGAVPGPGARTHYAFDTAGQGGQVRVIVIDNSAGSLAASDPQQNPAEPQRPWLIAVLADARAKGIPAIVMGSRDLNTRFQPRLGPATDGDDVARLLVAGGASAYVFDRPEENRALRIPAASSQTIPSFASGTLGYRSPIVGVVGLATPDSLFGDSGFLVLEVDASGRDAVTNLAPVRARLIPVIEDLSLEATDGTLLRRSRPALFRGLGRRPRGGDRWGRIAAGDGNPNPPGGDPYTQFPPQQCTVAGCSARITPEYQFTSSDNDIADFVRQDPNSTNLRKPLIDANDKVVTDNSSSLLCPFNAGTTTITVRAGGFSFSERITVQQGSVQRPCGTRPLRPDRFTRRPAGATPPPPPPPPPAPTGSPPIDFTPPPLPLAPLAAAPVLTKAALPPLPSVPLQPPAQARLPVIPPPPPPPAIRPLPPGGAPGRVYQVEKEREEEAAPEQSQAFSRYVPDDGGGGFPGGYVIGVVLLAAIAGAAATTTPRARPIPVRNHTQGDQR